MANNTSKKLFAGILALSAGVLLASCDPVSAIPEKYEDPIVLYDSDLNVDENNLGSLYDLIAGDRNSKVVNQLIDKIVQDRFGTYKEFNNAQSDPTTFLANHKDYFGEGAEATERFNKYKEDINSRISEYFYNEMVSGTYNDDLGRFSEKKLYNAHKYELYDLGKITTFKTPFFVDKEVNKDEAFSEKYFNVSAYKVTDGRGYIKEKVYPDIVRDKLVEDFIYSENYNAIGRAYARKVEYVKISYTGEEDAPFAKALMENFAKDYIEKAGNVENKYEILTDAYKGFVASEDANKLIANVSGETKALLEKASAETIHVDFSDDYEYEKYTLVPTGDYYKATKLGKILSEYADAIIGEKQCRFASGKYKTALEKFTSDGKSKQYGLFKAITDLMKEDYTTDGWYVKNGGLTELPDKIRDRLFNIKLANELDSSSLVKEGDEKELGAYEYVDGDKTKNKATTLPYVRSIYGKKVILPEGALKYDDYNQNYIYRDDSAFYICEVLEAPSTSKLNKSSDFYKEGLDKENIARNVAKVLSSKDSYVKEAYTHYFNKLKYEFTFYDTSLAEYLESEYPDLTQFED